MVRMVCPTSESELDTLLSTPTAGVLKTLSRIEGDFVVLGVGGKMGPTLARMLRRGLDEVGKKAKVIGVARFSNAAAEQELREAGIETIRCDLLDRDSVQSLPDSPNVIYMAGQKFGTTDDPARTWAMNTLAPAFAAEKYCGSRIVVFSTGCVYSNAPAGSGGSQEVDPLEPLGEYANSCVARERIFQYYSNRNGTPVLLFRLNYAIDLRYGVLLDVAQKVNSGVSIDLTMGYANVIWQGDANALAIRCLEHCSIPATALNVTGLETLSIRKLAQRFGDLLGREPLLVGAEAETALLNNAKRAHELFGPLEVSLDQMIEWTAEWVRRGGATLGKPTHFEVRDGRY